MKYMLIIQEHETDWAKRNDPADAPAYWQSWQTFGEIVRKADPDFSGTALQPTDTATTVRASGIQDGPFADTREQLGGFFLIDVANLDIALEIAGKCPAVDNGAVEVRPILPMEG
ncbi:MAG: YciI family protein [Pseudomonadota bacterium]